MKTTKINLLILSILCGSLVLIMTPQPVSAERTYHFTFRVPVELNNIPTALRSWRIWIHILGPADTRIGEKTTRFTVNKRYKGTKVIKFDADSGKNPADALEYRVRLQVLHGGTWKNACAVVGPRGTYRSDTTKPVRCSQDQYITR